MKPASEHEPPKGVEEDATWRGLGFEVANTRLVLPLTQVGELVACGHVTPVPLTNSWIRGIANVRGRLFTVVDLSAFLGKPALQLTQSRRVIVINAEGFQSALLVDNVLGLKHFDQEQQSTDGSDLDDALRPYVDYEFIDNDSRWAMFNVDRLVQDEKFRRVAVESS
ncbi:MAG: chemotaxis protein CheW [Gammaproteobacteria bacterium]|nr:chemotaxis protein CheW [Gammaproteobacteria bacterium]